MVRTCSNCGSDKTYIRPNGKPNWYGEYCKNCYHKLFTNPRRDKKEKQERSTRRLQYKHRRVMLKDNPRTGVCSLCRHQGLTNIHHEKYHDDDVLRDTIELCPRCHAKITFGLPS